MLNFVLNIIFNQYLSYFLQTSTKDDVSKPSLSDPPNDISWHDGLISEVAEDQKDKFLQRYQAITVSLNVCVIK